MSATITVVPETAFDVTIALIAASIAIAAVVLCPVPHTEGRVLWRILGTRKNNQVTLINKRR